MVVVEIRDGLGNQMFQYACGKALAIRNHDRLVLDLAWYDGHDGRPFQLRRYAVSFEECGNAGIKSLRTASKIRWWGERVFCGNQRIQEKQLGYDDAVFHAKGNLYLQGFWQSEKYFRDCKQIIGQDVASGPTS